MFYLHVCLTKCMHEFTIGIFNTSDQQCTYVALGYVFKSIVDATFTLPEIFPVPSYNGYKWFNTHC